MDLFQFYQYFPIDDQSGEPLSDAAVVAAQYERLTQFQRLLFKHHQQVQSQLLTELLAELHSLWASVAP